MRRLLLKGAWMVMACMAALGLFLAPRPARAQGAGAMEKVVTIYSDKGDEATLAQVLEAFSDPSVDAVRVVGAASEPPCPWAAPRNGNFYLTNVRRTGTYATGSVLARASDGPGITLSISKAVSVSNSYSCAASVSAGTISATLGFSVTGTETITVSGSALVPQQNGGRDVAMMTLNAHPLFDRYAYDVHIRTSTVPNTLVGTGTASQAVGVEFRRTYQYR